MQRAKHKVTGQRCLNRVFGSLEITNLTDQYDIWIVSQDASQRMSKGESDLLVDLDLVDPFQLILDRVFGGNNFDVRSVDFDQTTVQRRRFSRTGRTGYKHDAVRHTDQFAERFVGRISHTETFQLELHRAFVQNTKNQPFAMNHRNHRHTNVDFAAFDFQLDSPILRQAFLSDVQLGHDFQATDDRRLKMIDLRRDRL